MRCESPSPQLAHVLLGHGERCARTAIRGPGLWVPCEGAAVSRHTPGPWSASKPWYYEANGGAFYFRGDTGYVSVGQIGEIYDHALVLCSRGNNEGLANARLIAAAPELLDQCIQALAAWEGTGPAIALDDLRAVIAKATAGAQS